MKEKILVAGIGNIFLGDDAFGVEVVNRLRTMALPEEVRSVDFGIRGFDLAYALLEDFELAILVDAVPRGQSPGTLYVLEPDLEDPAFLQAQEAMIDTHGMNPVRVLLLAKSFGEIRPHILIVGCEPESTGEQEDGRLGLSEKVQAAVPGAIDLVHSLLEQYLNDSKQSHMEKESV